MSVGAIDTTSSSALEQMALSRLAQNKLRLPALPVTARACLELLRDPSCELRQAAGALEVDPILVTEVLRLANSAAWAGRFKAVTIEQALLRLGTGRLRALLVEVSTRRVFAGSKARIGTPRRTASHSSHRGRPARQTRATDSAPAAARITSPVTNWM